MSSMPDVPADTAGFARVMTVQEAQRQRSPLAYSASEAERVAIARHFGWTTLTRLDATLTFTGAGTDIGIEGRLQAQLTQPCVVTMQPVRERVETGFALRLVPADRIDGDDEDEERELDADALDTIGYRHGQFDLGAIIAETLALSVNPWPRLDNADAWLAQHDGRSPNDLGPFAALAALRRDDDAG